MKPQSFEKSGYRNDDGAHVREARKTERPEGQTQRETTAPFALAAFLFTNSNFHRLYLYHKKAIYKQETRIQNKIKQH